jgi:hypothetical protein
MKLKYKVRFHLAKGQNYKKWQVKYGDIITYYDPDKYIIMMYNCKLKNHKTVARQIFAGMNKTVCAWIECDDICITQKLSLVGNPSEVKYNPKENPFWTINGQDSDNKTFNVLHTYERKVFSPFMRQLAS